jgi:hypothetical protein
MKPYICAKCSAEPDAREYARIEADIEQHPTICQPAGWLCPACAPELQQAPSGLFFDVVDIGGSSPEHEYES